MRQICRLVGITLVTMLVTSCMQFDVVIKVRPDGSGTVEETVLMSKMAIQQMEQTMTGMVGEMGADASQKAEGFDLLDEEELKKAASEMGEGVSFVSAEKLATSESEGFKAIYAFADINKLKVKQDAGDKVPTRPGSGPPVKEKQDPVTFRFTKGDPATLLVRLPAQKPEEITSPQKPKPPPGESSELPPGVQKEMFKQMFGGMRMSMAIEVEGTIVETDATHREGARVTLMEVDFDKLLENEERFEEFSKVQPQSLEEAKRLMKDIPGTKIELNPEVKIKFKGAQPVKAGLEEEQKVDLAPVEKIEKVERKADISPPPGGPDEWEILMVKEDRVIFFVEDKPGLAVGKELKVYSGENLVGKIKITDVSKIMAYGEIVEGRGRIREGCKVR